MAHAVLFERAAARALEALPRRDQTRVVAKAETLADDPRPPGAKKLRESDDLWRVRVSDYRLIYRIRDRELVVVVVKVAHRREIYRRL